MCVNNFVESLDGLLITPTRTLQIYQRTNQLSGRWIRTTNLHHLSSYKGGALPVKLFPVYFQSTPSFSFNSWKLLSNSSTINFMSFRMSHIPLLDFSYTPFYHIGNCISNTQTNADYYYFKHIFQNLISVHKIVYSTMRTQIRRSDVRVEL